jgi:hypothetical protein
MSITAKQNSNTNLTIIVLSFIIAGGAGIFMAINPGEQIQNSRNEAAGTSEVLSEKYSQNSNLEDNTVYDYFGDILYKADENTETHSTEYVAPQITDAKYFTISWNGSKTFFDENSLRNSYAQASNPTELLVPDLEGLSENQEQFSSQIISAKKNATLYLLAENSNQPTAVPLNLLTFANPTLYFESGNVKYEIKYISEDGGEDKELIASVGDEGVENTTNVSSAKYSPSNYEYNADFNSNFDSGLQYSSLNIISRDVWGANTAAWDPYDDSDIDDPSRLSWAPYYYGFNRVVIHHTVSSNTYTDGAEQVRNIYKYHAYTRGWGDIGYNYLIDRFGNIYEAKMGGEGVFGYHAYAPANRMSIGISLIGDFTSEQPSDAMLNSLKNLLAEKALLYEFPSLKYSSGAESKWINSDYTVFGHRDSYFYCYSGHPLSYLCGWDGQWHVNATACPGNSFWPNLSSVVSGAEIIRKDMSRFRDIRYANKTLGAIGQGNFESHSVEVVFDLPASTSIAEVTSHIPDFSGISWYTIDKNVATLYVNDWNHSNGFVPPAGYTGPNYELGTFFPTSNGPADRVKMLLRLFRLRDDVVSADVEVRWGLH